MGTIGKLKNPKACPGSSIIVEPYSTRREVDGPWWKNWHIYTLPKQRLIVQWVQCVSQCFTFQLQFWGTSATSHFLGLNPESSHSKGLSGCEDMLRSHAGLLCLRVSTVNKRDSLNPHDARRIQRVIGGSSDGIAPVLWIRIHLAWRHRTGDQSSHSKNGRRQCSRWIKTVSKKWFGDSEYVCLFHWCFEGQLGEYR